MVGVDTSAPPGALALSRLAALPAVSSVILGARILDQLTANLPTGLQLSTEETALLDEVSAPRVDFPYGGAIAHQMTRRIEGGWPHDQRTGGCPLFSLRPRRRR